MPGGLVLLLHDHFPTHPAPYFHQPNFEVFAFHSCRGGVEEQRWERQVSRPCGVVHLKHRGGGTP